MKIGKTVSEKVTLKNNLDQFHSREFSASRTVEIPDNSPPELVRLTEVTLDYELRKQVLANFVLEGVITGENFNKMLAPYETLKEAAEKHLEEALSG